jgi:hypothetical protein
MHRFGLGYKGVRYSGIYRCGSAGGHADTAIPLSVNPDFINNLIVAKFTQMDKAKTHPQR